jgi:hypothetical protein
MRVKSIVLATQHTRLLLLIKERKKKGSGLSTQKNGNNIKISFRFFPIKEFISKFVFLFV